MNENEKARIAAATSALRPDWPATSIRTLLDRPELQRRTRRDMAVALTWVACESTTKTPARVLEAGPWWQAALDSTNPMRRPPRIDEECRTHPGEFSGSCRCCASEQKADVEDHGPADRPTPTTRTAEHVAAIRAQLRGATTEETP